MGKFIINLCKFLIILLGIGIISFVLLTFYFKEIPALKFSDSYSFNEKMLFLGRSSKGANVLAIGSSMSLNNLHSETVTLELQSKKFINTASWGMSIRDDYDFLKSLNKIYKITSIIIVSNIIDFSEADKNIDFEFVKSYLNVRPLKIFLSFIRNFDLKYYLLNFKYAQNVRNCINNYDYLKFDNYGTINFSKENFVINNARWNRDFLEKPKDIQYLYLDSLADYCMSNRIELLFFQSPMRTGIYSRLNQSQSDMNNLHLEKVKNILERDNFQFINPSDKLWQDSLFIDGIHFNEAGARLFTEFCFNKIDSIRLHSNKDYSIKSSCLVPNQFIKP
jgi:hypothetical protein